MNHHFGYTVLLLGFTVQFLMLVHCMLVGTRGRRLPSRKILSSFFVVTRCFCGLQICLRSPRTISTTFPRLHIMSSPPRVSREECIPCSLPRTKSFPDITGHDTHLKCYREIRSRGRAPLCHRAKWSGSVWLAAISIANRCRCGFVLHLQALGCRPGPERAQCLELFD